MASLPEYLEPYAGPAQVTIAYFGLYYAFIIYQGIIKAKVIKEGVRAAKMAKEAGKPVEHVNRYTSTDPRLLRADRSVLNMLEQMPAFVSSLWLYAVFVDANFGAKLGWFYLAFRAAYPFFFYPTTTGFSAKILYSTIPNYLVIFYYLIAVARRVF